MMPWFIWNGKNSLGDFGLWINKLPPIVRAQERVTNIQIPGRPGTVTMTEGEDVYDAVERKCVILARNSMNIQPVLEWLRGSGELIVSNEADKVYFARIAADVTFSRISNDLQQATVVFYCQPLKGKRYPETFSFTSDGSIFNPGDVASRPMVMVTGSGDKTAWIAGNRMKFYNMEGTLKVDCDAQVILAHTDAYDANRYYYKGDYCIASSKLYTFTASGTGSTLVSGGKRVEVEDWDGSEFDYIWPGEFKGEFWKIPRGTCTVTRSASASLEIIPRWRWV